MKLSRPDLQLSSGHPLEQTTYLVTYLGSRSNQPAPNAMERLQVLLLHGLSRYKLHVRSTHCFADRGRIIGIVLL